MEERTKTVEKVKRPDEWNRRLSIGAKKHWKEMSAETKAASIAPLDAGRAVRRERYKAERREWDAIWLRLTGSSLKEISEKLDFGKSRKRVRTAVRSVELPEGGAKRYVCDRGEPFTRSSGVEFCKALRQTYAEFAQLISTPDHPVREKRIVIWFTNSQKNLNPVEVRACQSLRARIATLLLTQDGGTRGFDRYSRVEVLAALFPRFRDEYQLLRAALLDLRTFLRANSEAGADEIAAFVILMAQEEKEKHLNRRTFRDLIRWLPELLPIFLERKAAIAGDLITNRLAVELLAESIGAPAEIVRHALNNDVQAISPQRMRELLRIYLLRSTATPITSKRKGGRKRGQVSDESQDRILFVAALRRLHQTNVYAMAPQLYPLGKRTRAAAESATRLLIKRNAKKIDQTFEKLGESEAKKIVEKFCLKA